MPLYRVMGRVGSIAQVSLSLCCIHCFLLVKWCYWSAIWWREKKRFVIHCQGYKNAERQTAWAKNAFSFPACFIWFSVIFITYVTELQNCIQTVRYSGVNTYYICQVGLKIITKTLYNKSEIIFYGIPHNITIKWQSPRPSFSAPSRAKNIFLPMSSAFYVRMKCCSGDKNE